MAISPHQLQGVTKKALVGHPDTAPSPCTLHVAQGCFGEFQVWEIQKKGPILVVSDRGSTLGLKERSDPRLEAVPNGLHQDDRRGIPRVQDRRNIHRKAKGTQEPKTKMLFRQR